MGSSSSAKREVGASTKRARLRSLSRSSLVLAVALILANRPRLWEGRGGRLPLMMKHFEESSLGTLQGL